MRTQDRDEIEEMQKYGKVLSTKDFYFWQTIDRRNTFRALRQTLYKIDIDLPVPMNLADITDEYCKKFGDPNVEQIKEPPTGWRDPNE